MILMIDKGVIWKAVTNPLSLGSYGTNLGSVLLNADPNIQLMSIIGAAGATMFAIVRYGIAAYKDYLSIKVEREKLRQEEEQSKQEVARTLHQKRMQEYEFEELEAGRITKDDISDFTKDSLD